MSLLPPPPGTPSVSALVTDLQSVLDALPEEGLTEEQQAAVDALTSLLPVEPESEGPDTTNLFFVGSGGAGGILIGSSLRVQGVITKPQALNLAAWLVALSDDDDEFDALLAAVRST